MSRGDAGDGDERGGAAVQVDAAGVCGEGEGVMSFEVFVGVGDIGGCGNDG